MDGIEVIRTSEPEAALAAEQAVRSYKNLAQVERAFRTLMAELGTRCGHRCRLKADPESPVIEQDTEPTPLQPRALELIRLFPVAGI